MTENEFLAIFRELIQEDGDFNMDSSLTDLESWDSMAIMALIAWFDVEHHKSMTFETLQKLQTVEQIAALVPGFRHEPL